MTAMEMEETELTEQPPDLQLMVFSENGARTMRDAISPRDVLPAMRAIAATEGEWFWLDVTGSPAPIMTELTEFFQFDRITRDDLLETQSPKFEELESGLLIVVRALAKDAEQIRTSEVDIFVSDGWLLTVHNEPVVSVDHVQERAENARFVAESPLHLTARLIEFVGERYLPILDLLDDQILELEDDAIEGDPTLLSQVHVLRRDISVLRRAIGPQRRMLEIMATRSFSRQGRAQRELADAVDHHVRLVDSLEVAHSLVGDLIDTYRSAAAERANDVMKTFTVFTAIFLPLTLMTGIYGMNFENMPELRQPWGYGAALGAMVLIAIGLWVYFVRRQYIGGPKLQNLARPAARRVSRGLAAAAALPVRGPARQVAKGIRNRRDFTAHAMSVMDEE